MSLGYQLAYRVGLTPWEGAGEAAQQTFDALLDREERDRQERGVVRPWGRALDLGCGSGTHTIELAERGWRAVGVDNVGRALGSARERPGAEQVDFVESDVTELASGHLAADVDFFLDVGCFHGLDDRQRTSYGEGVTSLAAPTATLLMLAFTPGHRPFLPRGASHDDVTRALPGWELLDTEAADTSGMPGPLKRTAPQWFRLGRRR